MRHFRREPHTEQRVMVAALNNDERIPGEILGGDEPRRIGAAAQAPNAEAASLAQRVTFEALMSTYVRAVLSLDRSGPSRQPAADEAAEGSFADEADARRIALVGDRQPALAGDGADFGLPQAANREFACGEL
jgi:hypothetical protein